MPTNSITQQQIDALVAASTVTVGKAGAKTTTVHVKLGNGFELFESSACVDPANYNEELGAEVCLRRIKDRLWLLEGYRLQCELAEHETKNWQDHA